MNIDKEEFSDSQAEIYNGGIENFEKGNLDDVFEVSLDELKR